MIQSVLSMTKTYQVYYVGRRGSTLNTLLFARPGHQYTSVSAFPKERLWHYSLRRIQAMDANL